MRIFIRKWAGRGGRPRPCVASCEVRWFVRCPSPNRSTPSDDDDNWRPTTTDQVSVRRSYRFPVCRQDMPVHKLFDRRRRRAAASRGTTSRPRRLRRRRRRPWRSVNPAGEERPDGTFSDWRTSELRSWLMHDSAMPTSYCFRLFNSLPA